MAFELLTISALETMFKSITSLLKSRKSSKENIKKLQDEVIKLVETTHGTGLAVSKYIALLNYSIKAGVHTTELMNLIDDIPEQSIDTQINRLLNDRIERGLFKNGIEPIHEYRDDYEKAKEYYNEITKHLNMAKTLINNKQALKNELKYTNSQIDRLVIHIQRRINYQLKPLTEAPKILSKLLT